LPAAVISRSGFRVMRRGTRRRDILAAAVTTRVYDIAGIRERIAPWKLHFVASCRSTNDLAARMRREGRLFAPAVVVTPRQTAGRGRGANKWSSDPGTLTATFALPVDETHPPHHLPLLAGLAVRDAAAVLLGSGSAIRLKWP